MINDTKDDILKQEYLQHDRIRDRRKFAIADISGRGRDVVFEVNWNKLVQKKGFIKITINGVDAVVAREQLWTILFMLGSAEEQEKLATPFIKQTRVTKFFKLIGVTAMKDIRAGEMLNVPLEFTLNPESGQVVIGKGTSGDFSRAARQQVRKPLA